WRPWAALTHLWEHRRPQKKSWCRRSSKSNREPKPRTGMRGTGNNLKRSVLAFIRSLCILRMTTQRCGERDTIIAIGVQHGGNVFQGLDLARRPAHFHEVNPCRRSQTEVKAQIVLRKITAAAAHFVELRHPSSVNRDARTDCGAVAFCSNQTEEHTMVRDFVC